MTFVIHSFLLLSLAGATVYGATVACPTGTSSTIAFSGSEYATVSGRTIPGAGSATATSDNALSNLNSYSGAANFASGGCKSVDLSFNNFAYSYGNSTGAEALFTNSTSISAADTSQASRSTVYGYTASATNTVSILFSSMRGDGSVNTDGNLNDGRNNFFDNGGNTNVNNIAFTVNAATSNLIGVDLMMRFYDFTSHPANSVTMTICRDYTAAAALTAGFTTCAGAGGTLSSTTISLVNLFNSTDTLDSLGSLSFAGSNKLYVNLNFQIDGSGTNNPTSGLPNAYLADIGLQFVETPEPSTFCMLGAALIGLAAIARRRKPNVLLRANKSCVGRS